MHRSALILSAALAVLAVGASGTASACQPRERERAAAAMTYEAALWDRSALVYLARIAAIQTDASGLETVRLTPEAVLKGEGRPDALVLDRITPLCTPAGMRFDALSGGIGEVFVIYAAVEAPTTFRDILSSIAPNRVADDATRAALDQARRSDPL